MNKRLKFLIMILALFGLIFVYVYYSSDKKGGDEITASPKVGEVAMVKNTSLEGVEILKMLENLESITLDASFFENKIFQGLIDFSVELTPEESGRPNPFAPLDLAING